MKLSRFHPRTDRNPLISRASRGRGRRWRGISVLLESQATAGTECFLPVRSGSFGNLRGAPAFRTGGLCGYLDMADAAGLYPA